jgi:hypothetical protein
MWHRGLGMQAAKAAGKNEDGGWRMVKRFSIYARAGDFYSWRERD